MTCLDEPYLGRAADPHPKLFSRIAAEGIYYPLNTTPQILKEFFSQMATAEVIVADDIVSFLASGDQDTSPWDALDTVTPPWSRIWIDYEYPSDKTMRFGALIINDRWATKETTGRAGITFCEGAHGRPPFIGAASAIIEYDHQGKLKGNILRGIPKEHTRWSDADRESWEINQHFHLGLVLAVLDFLHLKNATTEEQPIDRRHAKHCHRRFGTKQAGYTFRTVCIDSEPLRQYQRRIAESVRAGTMPLHKVRGTYTKYGAEHGRGLLFGKFSGKFFHRPHLRGKSENGIVHKDFKLRQPQLV